jgi:nucleotide-binding universal stress UspA family protein
VQQAVEANPPNAASTGSSESPLLAWERTPADAHSIVIACIDRSHMDVPVVAHAAAVAGSLHCTLVLAQVLEPATYADGPQDPVSWGVRRHKCRERFDWVSTQNRFERPPEQVLLEGRAAEELAHWVDGKDGAFLALATRAQGAVPASGLGNTARRLLDYAPASLLLVPPSASATPLYRRIMVPLDGSCRAESVLPTVVMMARDGHAEILLVHIVPEPQFTQIGPLEPEAILLRDKVIQRNEQVARTYMERVLRHIRSSGVDARSIIVHGDARERLQHIALDEGADLLIMATHGQSGRADMSCGTIASFLADHAMMPMLILRNDTGSGAAKAGASEQDYCSFAFRS